MKGIVLDLNEISDSREVMESQESPKIRWFIYILTAAVLVSILCAYIFEIDEYVKVNGEIKTYDAKCDVMSDTSCRLKSIQVSEGQIIKKGDILFTLDSEYATEQKEILDKKLSEYNLKLENIRLLRQSVEEERNLFQNNESDSDYYYRYEQYKNQNQLAAYDIDSLKSDSKISEEERASSLVLANQNIQSRKNTIAEYKQLLSCIQGGYDYTGSNTTVRAEFDSYIAGYRKAQLLSESYRATYEAIQNTFNTQSEKITFEQVEAAKQKSEDAYTNLKLYQSEYFSEIQEDEDTQEKYDEKCAELTDAYSSAKYEYQVISSAYMQQSSFISESDVANAKLEYDASVLDAENIKNTFCANIQNTISTLSSETESLENNKENIELMMKKDNDIDSYQQITEDKLKNEMIISLNNEITSVNEAVANIESQIRELDEMIKNSEIRASSDGKVTLIKDLCSGDIIQAGNTLCTIVPEGSELKAMLYIPENEITKVSNGQKILYSFDAISRMEYGNITGCVTSISADSISDEVSHMKYYVAQADISDYVLENKNGDICEIRNGMIVEAKMVSGSKKAIVWLLEKLNFVN